MSARATGSDLEKQEDVTGGEIDYEDVLEKIGFGKAQWLLLLIGGLLTLNDLGAQQSVGIIAVASQCEFGMNQMQKGVMMASCVAGVFLSTYFAGYMTDAVGRHPVLLYSNFASCVFQFFSMFATNVWVFNLMNFFTGICLGGNAAALYPYLAEFNKLKHRAVVINFVNMFISVSTVYGAATAWLLLSADWSIDVVDGFTFRPWRLIIILNLLPGFIAVLLLLLFPESPKLLLSHKKVEEAVKAVDWLCRFNTGVPATEFLSTPKITLKPEEIPDADLLSDHNGCGVLVAIWEATKPLFHKPHCFNFMIAVAAVFCMCFSTSGIKLWFPEIVNRSSGEVGNSSSTVCNILDESFKRQGGNETLQGKMICDDTISTKTYINNIILGLACVFGYVVQGVLLNPMGRKNVRIASLFIAVFSGNLLNFVTNPTMVLILFCLYILMPRLAISNTTSALLDLMPTHLRTKAVSISFTLCNVGEIMAANLAGSLMEPLCNTMFAIFTGSMLICLLLVHILPP